MTDALMDGFFLGPYRISPRNNLIEGPDGAHHVEPKVMAVLMALAGRPGELVTRQTLLDEVWDDVVVLDETVTKAIQVLRGYFGDKPAEPRFIRTVPKRGYELIAPVSLAAPIYRQDNPPEDGAAIGRRARLSGWRGLVAVAVVASVAAALYFLPGYLRETVTVAVIPPAVSGDPGEFGYVGEGLADYLIDALSRTRKLEVVARRSSFMVRDTEANVRAIGEQLEAQYLIEGSIRPEGEGLLLTLFLVDTETGTNVWTTRLRGAQGRLSTLQRQSAEALRDAFRSELGIVVRQAPQSAAVPEEAYRKYLEARYQWTLRGERRIDRSIALLEEALALEPDYAAAHLALAQSVAVQPFYDDGPLGGNFERARASAHRALALDPSLAAEVSALEGFMLYNEWRWAEAQASLEQALALDPNTVNARYWYANFLSRIGRYEEALTHAIAAQKLDPVSAVLNDRLAVAYVWVGDLEHASERYREAIELGYLESSSALGRMLFLYRAGRFDAMSDLMLRLGGSPEWVTPTIAAFIDPSTRETAGDIIDAIGSPDPLLEQMRFGIWMVLGDTDRAFRDFDAEPKSSYIEALWSKESAHIRADPRFEGLLESLNFTGTNRDLLPISRSRPSSPE